MDEENNKNNEGLDKKEEIVSEEKKDPVPDVNTNSLDGSSKEGFWKKNGKKVIVGVIILIIVAILAVVLSMIFFGKTTFDYHGMTFEKVAFGGIFVYQTNISIANPTPVPFTIVLRNDPRKLDAIPANFSVFHGKGFFSFTPETLECTGDALIAAFQVGQFVKALGGTINATVTENFSNNTLPVKTCDDANKNVSILVLKPFSEQTRIYTDENNSNCIILEAKNCSVVEVSERFVLALIDKNRRPDSFTNQIAQVMQ